MAKFCKNCGSPIQEGVKFCTNCGTPVEQAVEQPMEQSAAQPVEQTPKCAFCGADLKATSKFCPVCGKPVGGPTAPAGQGQALPQMVQTAAQRRIHVAAPGDPRTAQTQPQPFPRQAQGQYPQQMQPPAAPPYGAPYPQQPVKKRKKSLAVLLPAVAVLLAASVLITGLVTPGWMKTGSSKGKGPSKSSTLTVDEPMAKAGGVTVNLGEWFVLEEDAELSVTPGETESNEEEGWKMETYDISVGDLHQLDDFVEIRLPYDSSYFDEGQDPAMCLGAKYYDEEAGDWKDILCTVDTEAEELVIYTDHFSRFGAFYVRNEGMRSAYISSISWYYAFQAMGDLDDLTEYCADKETMASKALQLGVKFMDFETDSRDIYAYGLDYVTFGQGSDYLSGAIKGANTNWLTQLGYAAIGYNLVKMTVQTATSGKADKELVLNTLHTAASTLVTEGLNAMTQAGSAGLAVAMSGVYVTGKMLNTMFQGAADTKMELMDMVYWHYLESYTGRGHKPMTAKDWRSIVIKLVEKYPDDPEMVWAGIDAKVNQVSESFFSIDDDELAEVVTDLDNITITHFPQWTNAEKEKMVANYSAHLKNEVLPAVLTSVQNYLVTKAEQAVIDQLEETKDFYNTKVTVTVKEEPGEDGSFRYADHTVRFAPLDDVALQNAKSWTGKLKADGTYQTTVTFLGLVLAGMPHEIQIFKPGDDPNTAEPVQTVPFTIDFPTIDVTLSSGTVSLEELAGDYVGTTAIKRIKIDSEYFAFYQSISDEAEAEHAYTEAECDDELNAEAGDSWPSDESFPIRITVDDAASGACTFSIVAPSDEGATELKGSGVFKGGVITFTGNGGTLTSTLNTEKTADGKIALKGGAILALNSSDPAFADSAVSIVQGDMNVCYIVLDVDCVK